ncbi:HNH endonuclease family protein [Nonomuraea sp. NPDC023979]|uniref:HNH endonuclease family protein n=1 Tax=Nonomuraea sp. NPDC023979 TaxID=3154796 RepID=UPI0033F99228
MSRFLRLGGTALIAIAFIPAASFPAAASPGAAARAAEGLLLADAVATLPVAAEQREGYKRTSFKHWTDSDRDGCSTRYEVLLEEAVTAPEVADGCRLNGGSWHSYYDDKTITDASGLDVDHVVPLAESWDSGAYAWDAAQREAYANYLDHPWHLVAVTARSNRSKADQDPSTWQPPVEGVRCRYAAEWTAIKIHWQLSIDPAEQQALNELGAACPEQRLPSVDEQLAR